MVKAETPPETTDADADLEEGDDWALCLVDSVDPQGGQMIRELRAAGLDIMEALAIWQTRRLASN